MKTSKIKTIKQKKVILKSLNFKDLTIILFAIFISTSLSSQKTMDDVLIEIEKNNTTLSSIRSNIAAKKLGNQTGIYLQNPEIEFGYLWGDPSGIGNRTDLSITQSFQFPTAYKYKKHISNMENDQLEIEYLDRRKSILLESKLICIELIYSNSIISNWQTRLNNAQTIADAYKKKFEAGEANIIEFNKAQLNFLNYSNKIKSLKLIKNSLLAKLIALNGGIEVSFDVAEYSPILLNDDFEKWFTETEKNIPSLNWYDMEYDKNQNQIKLDKASLLPKFQAGYMSEKVANEQFQGVAFGLSIPLWENKNTVKHSKAKSLAIEDQKSDSKIRIYSNLKSLHYNTKDIEKNLIEYRKSLLEYDNSSYLKKAFDNGEISLIDYLMEMSLIYESLDVILLLEKDLNIAYVKLNQFN